MTSASCLRGALVLGLLGGMAACTSSLFDSKASVARTYVLAPAPAPSSSGAVAAFDVVVSEPTSSPGLHSERIAVLHPDRHLEYYAGARWGGTAAEVMQSLIVGSMRNQHLFRSVTAASSGNAATHVVDIELRDFQAEYGTGRDAPTVKVTIVANVLRLTDRKLIAVIPATASVPANENRLTQVVAAFEAAAQQVALSVNRDTAAALANDSGSAR
ncbi:MAG: ABC-type transport auxiliary lipoprotein family protein [Steroidobacteraceae bacterium]